MQQIYENEVDTLHISVDDQDYYIFGLSERRYRQYPKDKVEFAEIIHPVPTLRVVYRKLDDPDPLRIYPASLREKIRRPIFEKYGLTSIPAEGEDIYIKYGDSAFEDGILLDYINKKYPNLKRLVFTGMNTRFCMVATIKGAQAIRNANGEPFVCVAIYDRMADCRKAGTDSAPMWHQNTLERDLIRSGAAPQLLITDADKFLRAEGASPAPASSRRPGKLIEEKRFG